MVFYEELHFIQEQNRLPEKAFLNGNGSTVYICTYILTIDGKWIIEPYEYYEHIKDISWQPKYFWDHLSLATNKFKHIKRCDKCNQQFIDTQVSTIKIYFKSTEVSLR